MKGRKQEAIWNFTGTIDDQRSMINQSITSHPNIVSLVEERLEGIFLARLGEVVDEAEEGVVGSVEGAIDPLRLEGKPVPGEVET